MKMAQHAERIHLSAVVPNYNHGALIEEAVRALAAQVPAPDEIIVVDDGSTDDSLVVLDRLRAEVGTMRVVPLDRNRGAIFALNRGLQEARGTYVYFGAADDVTLPGLFADMLDVLDRFPQAAFACGEGIVVDMDTGKSGYRPPVRPAQTAAFLAPDDVARTFRRIDNWMLTGTALIRRDLIADAGGFDAALGAFADGYALRRLALLHGCCFVPHMGLVWRVSARGLSRAQAADPAATLHTLAAALQRMDADSVFPRWYLAVFERRWRFSVSRLAAQSRPMNRAVLVRVGARGPVGRAILGVAAALGGPFGRLISFGWLSLRERPTSFAGLIATALSRRCSKTWRNVPNAMSARNPEGSTS
jgi:glycosyltransferase involved in cell wall biosynthesis